VTHTGCVACGAFCFPEGAEVAKSHRLSRLLEIVSILQGGRTWNASELAERYDVSRKRLFDDIKAIRGAGIPVRSSRKGYWIDKSFSLPSVKLQPREALALMFPMEQFTCEYAEESVRQSALSKLLTCLKEPLRSSARALLERTNVAVPVSEEDGESFEVFREAVARQKRVQMTYASQESGKTYDMQLDPYALAFRKHAWYVVGHSWRHNAIRTFRISRVRSVELLGLGFTMPDGFSVEERFQGAWYVFSGQPQEIGLKFRPRAARLVRERVSHPGQQIQEFSDGSIYYRARVNSLDEVAWWLVQYGDDAKVVFPPELEDRVVHLARGIVELYGGKVVDPPRPYPRGDDDIPGTIAEGEE